MAGVKSLTLSSMKKSDLLLIRKKTKRGFECKLTSFACKKGCLAEINKVFPFVKNNLSLLGMQELIEVINRCQKK